MKIRNRLVHAIDSPITLAPGEVGDCEDSEDVQRLIESGAIEVVEDKATDGVVKDQRKTADSASETKEDQ